MQHPTFYICMGITLKVIKIGQNYKNEQGEKREETKEKEDRG